MSLHDRDFGPVDCDGDCADQNCAEHDVLSEDVHAEECHPDAHDGDDQCAHEGAPNAADAASYRGPPNDDGRYRRQQELRGQGGRAACEATRKDDETKLKALLIQSLDKAAGAAQKSAVIELDEVELSREPNSITKITEQLEPGGRCEVYLSLTLKGQGRRVEVKLKGKFHMSPAVTAKIEGLRPVRAVRSVMEADRGIAA